MNNANYAVIMAGGGGTRLWPLSRRAKPKQMLSFGQERTLFQMACDRLGGLFSPDHILVVTVAEQAEALQAQYPEIPRENFLLEPLPRGTASVVGLAAIALRQRDPDATMAVMAADHFIDNTEAFRQYVACGLEAARSGWLVTLGITPTFPSTGYGYIQLGEPLGAYQQQEIFRVAKFKEKPGLEQAQAMLAGGDHAWNSGMFVWTTRRILADIERLMPDLAGKLATIDQAWNSPQRDAVLQSVWPTIQPETIDFGVMEKANDVAVVPARDLGWNDVGSWDSLFDVLPGDEQGNLVIGGGHIGVNSKGTLVFNENSGRVIATIGVENLVIVDTGDAVLICPRDQAQQVRQVVDRLKKDGRNQYL